MLAIKLQRIGKKHQPSYRLVVAVNRSKMAAPPVEDLGSYHPATKAATFKKERVSYWLGVGAQPTVTVHNLLVNQGIIVTPKRAVKMKKAVVGAAPAVEAKQEAPVTEASIAPDATPAPVPAAEEPASATGGIEIKLTEIENPEA